MIGVDHTAVVRRAAGLGTAFALGAVFVLSAGLVVVRGVGVPAADRTTAQGLGPRVADYVHAATAQGLGPSTAGYVHAATWSLPEAPAEPIDVAMSADGYLFVADGRDNTVLVLNRDGEVVDRWADPPTGPLPGHVYVPLAVTCDLQRDVVYVLWQRFADEPGGLVAGGYFLDSRRPDGAGALPLQALTFLDDIADLAVEPSSGDLFFLTGDAVTRLTVPGGVPLAGFLVGAGARRLAVAADGTVVVVRTAARSLERHRLDGELLDSIDLGARTPLDATADASDGALVLVRSAAAADPDADLVVHVDGSGDVSTRVVAADLAAPVPPDGQWPWAVAWAPEGAALSTGDIRFEVHRFQDGAPMGSPLEGGSVQSSYAAHPVDPMLVGAGLSVSAHPDGDVSVLDAGAAHVVRFDRTGHATLVAGAPAHAVDLAVDGAGTYYVSTSDGWLQRSAAVDGAPPAWVIPCECGLGGRLAVADGTLYLSRPRRQRVAELDTSSGIVRGELRALDAVGLWPADVTAPTEPHDGADRLFTADLVTARVQAWTESSAPRAVWRTGLLSGPRRLAAGRLSDGSPVLAGAMADGFVELHGGIDGSLFGRWQPVLADGSIPEVSDIAVGAEGRVFLADARARAVHVFEPAGGIPPTDEPAPMPSPTPSDMSCAVRGDKVVRPSTVVLGSSAVVTLTIAAECPASSRLVGADIVLVTDRSGSMRGEKLSAAQGAARSFAEMLDVRVHRLGLVSFSTDAVVDVPLTDDVGEVIDGLDALQADGGTNIAAALSQARDNLASHGRREALPVIVLLSDGRLSEQQPDPRAVAAEIRAWGAQLYTIGLGEDVDGPLLAEIAGRAERYYGAPAPSELYPIYGEILRAVVSSLAGNLVIDDELDGALRYVTGSARPLALESPGRLRWGRSILPSSGLTLTYEIQPGAEGCVPTSRRARAEYTDGDGVRRTFTFPVPTICAVAGTATATPPPIATPLPTSKPTVAPVPSDLFLPVVARHACVPTRAHADVVLLIDTSSSMDEDKLAAAKAAATLFLDYLDFPRDQAAVVGFDAQPRRAVGLTTDRLVAMSAVEDLRRGSGTRVDLALYEAIRVLTGPGHRPDSRPVIVLLSDGAHGGARADALNAAADSRDLGALVFTIGLGASADSALLEAIAGDRGRYFYAPTTRELAEIYQQVAVTIPCR